jgi:hypothetical protein
MPPTRASIHSNETSHQTEKTIMTTSHKKSPTTAHDTSTIEAAPAAPAATATAPAAASIFLQPPPADAKIPTPPAGTSAPNGANYRAFLPRSTEVAALASAVTDLRKCTNFATLFGATALPYAQVLQAFDVGNQWTTMRNETAAWDAFCQTQEGIAWQTIRVMMDRLRPAFDLAVTGDATIASTMPGLAALLGAKKAIAQKAVATKKANKAAVARGEAPVHGVVGKRRLRAAQKALLPAAKAATAGAASSSTPPPTSANGSPPASAPVGGPQGGVTVVAPANGTPSNGTAAH